MKLLCILLTIAALTSCTKETITGSGSTLTETRTVDPFTKVKLEGSGSVTVTQGTQQKVEVTGYENLLQIYETKVQNGLLILKFKNDYYNVHNSNISVNITVNDLATASINGSGKFAINNFNGSSLAADINGSGDIFTESCVYNKVVFKVNGSGYIRGQNVHAKEAEVEVNGSGKLDITCTEDLSATIHGSGQINYWGNPADVSVQISGSGSVKKK